MKKWYESKTIWLNIASIVVVAGSQLANSNVLGTKATTGILVGVNIGNLILRTLTNTGIK